ncbi:uncharacterized protein LOC111035330 [Myzus persicae]|uniref:uncharacterized protein LOC111035330 n=1 Tax=Myzus persicae TaxID=13164 RepID=UPI000B935556|nr:uncharacterized protein LOC111035330 [Myzus persicae]
MADLPACRVDYAPVFSHCGVDFAGPSITKPSVGRSRIVYKTYLSLFICLTTKAVHLEIVIDLSADTFIATLKRFVARRGYPTKMNSDNGTNFTSTHYKLHGVYKLLCSQQLNSALNTFCLPREIDWHFIPPASPHFGGIWEANIKSCKRILQRITLNSVFVCEELYTLFCQVEEQLNSRPLCPASMEATDYSALTPGHFLLGKAPISLPEVNIPEPTPTDRLTRWNRIQKLQQSFWKQWSQDYLATLQQRSKWTTSQPNLQVNYLSSSRKKIWLPLSGP